MKRAIILVDHGSRRHEANMIVADLAAMVAERVADDTVVTYAHLELAEPDIATALQACADAEVEEVIVHPLMLTPGRHATEDIPRIVKERAADHPGLRCRVTAPLGAHGGIADAVLDRCACEDIGAEDRG